MITTLYRGILKKTSTFFFVAAVGAVFFERGFDAATDNFFRRYNKGKLWEDIQDKYQ